MEKNTRTLTLAALLGAAVTILGCSQPGTSTAANDQSGPETGKGSVATTRPAQSATIAEVEAAKTLDEPLRAFGTALFREQVKASSAGNVFLSPVSLSQALAMTMNGAAGQTRAAMSQTLGLGGMDLERANAASAALSRVVTGESEGVNVNIANALWGRQGVTFAPEFVRRVEKGYNATVKSPMSAPAINAWVKKETNGKIEEIVTAGDVAAADAVLTNAVYFKGIWTFPFDKAATKDGKFTTGSGQEKTLPMMRQTARFGYTEGENWRGVRLGTGPAPKPGTSASDAPGRRLAVYFVLPNEGVALDDLAGQWDAAAWDRATRRGAGMREVDLTLPRFKAEYSASLKKPLADLGMGAAFGPNADFSPMGLGGDFIGDVLHKAGLEVNEEGAEAAAATAITLTRAAPEPPVRLTFDRPFLVAIRDDATGALLFLGAIRDPQPL